VIKMTNVFYNLVKRNVKLYFKDKVTFFMSLITPFILLLLFLLFLKNVYMQSLDQILATGNMIVPAKTKESFVAAWLISSILSTSTITVSFCSATIIVSDKINRSGQDMKVAPVSKWMLFLSYLVAVFFATMIVMLCILVFGFVYLAIVGWYLSFTDVLQIISCVVLLTLFGSVLSCIIFTFIKTQGGTSAVATLISSCYGFMSGAYMPLSQYPKVMAGILGFNPGVYGTCILKNAFMGGAIDAMNLPLQLSNEIKNGFDLNYFFFGNQVPIYLCFILLISITSILLITYIFIARFNKKHG